MWSDSLQNKCSEWASQVMLTVPHFQLCFFLPQLSCPWNVRNLSVCMFSHNSTKLDPSWLDSIFTGAVGREGGGWQWWRSEERHKTNHVKLTQIWPMDEMDYCTEKYAGDWKTYLEPADVKSPHRSELGWAAGAGELKSKRGAGFGEK